MADTEQAEGEDMKVVVDLSICDLHGLCVEAAPEVFEIGDDGALHVLIEMPPDGLRAKVDKAHRWRLARGPACGRDTARPRLRW